MRADSPGLLLTVVGLVLVAGLLSAAEAALAGFSRARAEELDEERRPGARRVLKILEDPPRYLNTALFLRLLTETSSVVLATLMIQDALGTGRWAVVFVAVGLMLVVSFVVVGVAPRTRLGLTGQPFGAGSGEASQRGLDRSQQARDQHQTDDGQQQARTVGPHLEAASPCQVASSRACRPNISACSSGSAWS